MDARCAVIAADGKSKGSLPGCKTTAVWSPDGNTTSKTSSASSNSHACSCYSGIYEMGSSVLAGKPLPLPAGMPLYRIRSLRRSVISGNLSHRLNATKNDILISVRDKTHEAVSPQQYSTSRAIARYAQHHGSLRIFFPISM